MSEIVLDVPENDAFYGKTVTIAKVKSGPSQGEFVVRDAKTGRLIDMAINSFNESEPSYMNRMLKNLEKAKLPFETERDHSDMIALAEPSILPENPIIALPKLWPEPHQVICLNIPGELYSCADKDVLTIGDVMKASHEGNATMALLMFLAEIVHKSVVGMGDAKPPKKRKKKAAKKGRRDEEGEAEVAPDANEDEYEEIPFIPIDSYVRDLGSKGFLRNSFKHYAPGHVSIDVPRLIPMMERLVSKSLTTIGYRFFIFVLDPSYDFNEKAEEMMRRIHSMQTDHNESKTAANAKQEQFCNPIDYTCYRRVGSMRALSTLLQLYYGNQHKVSTTLREFSTQLDSPEIGLSNQYCKAHLSTVLSLENALEHPMVKGACAAQKDPKRYKVGDIARKFPLPMAVHSLEYSMLEPKHFYKTQYPLSIYHRLYKERMTEARRVGNEPMFSEPDCDIKIYSAVCQAVGSKTRTEIDSMLAAGRAKANPTIRSIKDSIKNLDILAAKGPAFEELRREIESTYSPEDERYRAAMNTFKVEQIQNCWDLFLKYGEMTDLYSPAYIASISHLRSSDASEQWADWHMLCKNLDPHAQALLLLMQRMTRVHKIKRGAVQRNCLRHYFSMLTSAHPHDRLKCNLLTIDSQSTSKSFALQVIEALALDNTCQNFSHVTANAFNVGGTSRNGITLIMEEMNPAMIGVGSNGKAAPSELSSNMKNMLTNQRTTSLSCFIDEYGNRRAVTSIQPVRGAVLAAMNHRQNASSTGKASDVSADLSRFLMNEPDPVFKTDGEATLQDLVCGETNVDSDEYNNTFAREMQTFHAIFININMMIGCNVLHKVNYDLVSIVCSELNRRLSRNGLEKMTTRRIEQVRELAVAICAWSAIVICTGMEHSMTFRYDESRNPTSYGPAVIREIEKLLVVNSQHVMFALTLLNSNIVPLARQQVQEVLWKQRGKFKPREYRYKEGNMEVLDPRYDLLEVGTLDNLASTIAEHSQSDVSSQMVRTQLDIMFKITKEGDGVSRIVLRDQDGYSLNAKEVTTAKAATVENEKWQAKLLMIPPERTIGLSNRYSSLLVLKRGYDPVELKKHKEKVLNEEWLALEIADILSHAYTKPRTLVHAGVLRRPAGNTNVIQGALGVVRIETNENNGLIYPRSTHVSSIDDAMVFNTRKNYKIHKSQRQPWSFFRRDHDETLLVHHHLSIGIEPDLRLLPDELNGEMLRYHDAHPNYFQDQDNDVMDNYPKDYYVRFDNNHNETQAILANPLNKAKMDKFASDPMLADRAFHNSELALSDKVEARKREEAAAHAREMALSDRIASVVRNNNGTPLTKSNTRGFTAGLDPVIAMMARTTVPNDTSRFPTMQRTDELPVKPTSEKNSLAYKRLLEIMEDDVKPKEPVKRIEKKKKPSAKFTRQETDDSPIVDEGTSRPAKKRKEATLEDERSCKSFVVDKNILF